MGYPLAFLNLSLHFAPTFFAKGRIFPSLQNWFFSLQNLTMRNQLKGAKLSLDSKSFSESFVKRC
jgi:hypothetical protein